MQLSIIIPVYNVAAYLPETLDSVLGQELTDFELILVDDGSTDGSAMICDEYAARDGRVVVIHRQNGGVSDARNTGIAAARGDFIGFVDSDDLIEPAMFSAMLSVAAQTGAQIVQCRHDRAASIAGTTPCGDYALTDGAQFVRDQFTLTGGAYTNQVALWSKIYRRELFDGVVFPVGRTYEDEQETYKICLRAEGIALMPDVLYHYVRRENSIITGVSAKKMLDKQTALRDRLHFLPEKLPELREKCGKSYYQFSMQILIKLSRAGEQEAYRTAKAALMQEKRTLRGTLDRYGRTYLRWLGIPPLEKWLMRTDGEPIQSILRKIRGNRT